MNTTTTLSGGHSAAACLRVRLLVPVFEPRSIGGVRLLADGGLLLAPSGPPLID